MNQFRLSIDYGTSNTVAMLSWPDGRVRPLLFDGTPLLPSAVFAQADGSVLTGKDAQRNTQLDPSRFEGNPKRRIDDVEVLLGDRSWPVVELVATTLERVALEARRTAGGQPGTVTMTYPVEWGPVRRDVLVSAALKAGLPEPLLVPEPTAAAAYFAANLVSDGLRGRAVIVYDLGGGTFDVSVVRGQADGFRPLAHRGIDDFGGVDLDALVMGQIGEGLAGHPEAVQRLRNPQSPADRRHSRALWDDARTVKESLSRQPNANVFVPVVDREVHVSREAFESAARPALERTIEVTKATMRESQIQPGDVAGLFLVGGSSRVPLVATMLHQALGFAPKLLEQPETVVAEGALKTGETRTAPPAPVSPPPAAHAPAPVVHQQPQHFQHPAAVPAPRQPHAPRYPQPEPGPAKKPGPAIPVTSGILILLGLVLAAAGPFTGYRDTATMQTLIGSGFVSAGGIVLWFWPKFPVAARFAVPVVEFVIGLWFLIAPVTYLGAPDSDGNQQELPKEGVGFFAMAAIILLIVTAATLGLRRKSPPARPVPRR